MLELPTIYEFLDYLSFLRGYPAAYLILITSALILILRAWRISLLALLVQYLIVGLLFADVLIPHLAFIKVIVGIFICLILFVTAQQVNWGRLPEDASIEEAVQMGADRLIRFGPYMLPTEWPFRLFLAVLISLTVLTVDQINEYQLPVVPDPVNLAIYALLAMGIVTFSLTSEPYKSGMGILSFLTGIELFFSALDTSLAIIAMFAAINLIVVLAIAHLTQARHAFQAILD